MGSQQFCLKWNKHHSNILDVFGQLLSSQALVDVTLACDGVSLKAHKMVLSACSPFFHSLFLENPCKHPIVILKDIRYAELKAIVEFMYRGEVNVAQDQLPALLRTAETLKVKGLSDAGGEMESCPWMFDANSPPDLDDPPSARKRKRIKSRRRPYSPNCSDSDDQPSSRNKESKLDDADENGSKTEMPDLSFDRHSCSSELRGFATSDGKSKVLDPTQLMEHTLEDGDEPLLSKDHSQNVDSDSVSAAMALSIAAAGAHSAEAGPSLTESSLSKARPKISVQDAQQEEAHGDGLASNQRAESNLVASDDEDVPLVRLMDKSAEGNSAESPGNTPLIKFDRDLFADLELGTSLQQQCSVSVPVPSAAGSHQMDERMNAVRSVLKYGMSIRKASKVFQIPRTTLRRSVATYKSKGYIP